jgi:tartrate-resistant acid phosphatase type 5
MALFSIGTVLVAVAGISSVAATSSSHELTFLVLGDWGRQGTWNQSQVAALMGKAAHHLRPSFVISTGDNMYPNGQNSTSDPLFFQSFSSVYTSRGLQVPWHAVFGNHDYGDAFEYCENDASSPCDRGPLHLLSADLTARDWRWHCERSYTEQFLGGLVEFFFIDTSPFILDYHTRSWAQYKGGIASQSWELQLKEVEARLSDSKALYKIVVGHHPPRSNGEHGNNTEIMQHLGPLMERYGVSTYFAGHDHNLEHLHLENGLNIFVSGGGSDTNRGFETAVDSKYQYANQGFVAATITEKKFEVSFYTLESGMDAAYTATLFPPSKL